MSEETKKILDSKKVQYALMGLLPNQAEQVLSAMEFVSQKTAEKIFKELHTNSYTAFSNHIVILWDKFKQLKKEFGVEG